MRTIRSESDRSRFLAAVTAAKLPLLVECKRATADALTDAKRARIHIVLRECASHFGYSADAFKLLAKRGELPDVTWPGAVEDGALGGVWRAVPTMKLTGEQATQLLLELESFGAGHGVAFSAYGTMAA